MLRDWPWPPDQLEFYGRKALRAMRGHDRAGELARAGLIWLALGRLRDDPVRDLKGWVRPVPLAQLREWLESFDAPELREWVERQVGFPDHSQGFGDRSTR